MTDPQRAAFETWASSEEMSTATGNCGWYIADGTAKAWRAWQAAQAADAGREAVVEELPATDAQECRKTCTVCWGENAQKWPCAKRAAENGQRRGTDAQILFERKLTCEAINGAMAFGYQNTNPPPSDDHWLAPYWKIGRSQADLVEALELLCDEFPNEDVLLLGFGDKKMAADSMEAYRKARTALSRAKEQKS